MSDIKYLNLKQIAGNDRYPFTAGQLRHYLLMRHRNGLETAVRKIGKRIFIREDLFDAWIDQQRGQRQWQHTNYPKKTSKN